MSYLILDTDKHTTHALRLQLSRISQSLIFEVPDLTSLAAYKKAHPVPPEAIFLDIEGDRSRVASFQEYLATKKSPSSALVVLSSQPSLDVTMKVERHLRKPVFEKNLRTALIDGQRKCQEARSVVTFFGSRAPAELSRAVGRSPLLWKQIIETIAIEELVADRMELTSIGALFLRPEIFGPKTVAAIQHLYKTTSASRISIICLSRDPLKIRPLRSTCDFFIEEAQDWNLFLNQLAMTRLLRAANSTGIDQAKLEMKLNRFSSAKKVLNQILANSPLKTEALLLSAECSYLENKYEEAAEKYIAVTNQNPCLPKPYARLLSFQTGSARERTLAQAKAYCPEIKAFNG